MQDLSIYNINRQNLNLAYYKDLELELCNSNHIIRSCHDLGPKCVQYLPNQKNKIKMQYL